jgi:hypothetical protein
VQSSESEVGEGGVLNRWCNQSLIGWLNRYRNGYLIGLLNGWRKGWL